MKKDAGFVYTVTRGTPYPPGISRQGERVNICVDAKDKSPCCLLLFHPGEKEPCHRLEFEEQDRYGSLYAAALEQFPVEAYEYSFQIGEEEVCDPYAFWLCGREAYGEEPVYVRGRYPGTDYDWEEDLRPDIPYEDGILYTAHVRGLTMDPSSRVKHRGTFEGIMERIPYLKQLGINMLELMPAYEFEERMPRAVSSMAYFMSPEQREHQYKLNYWGYGTGSYFAPKASYAASSDPVKEFRDMVKALHRAGIELIMEFYFPEDTYPGMILDCLKYWALTYHVDGFHLSGCSIPMGWIAKEPLLSDRKLMGADIRTEEIFGEHTPRVRRLAQYHDGGLVDMRRFLRGDENQTQSFAWRMKHNPSGCGTVNYIASHNGFTLYDMVCFEERHNEENGEDNRDGTSWNFSCNYGEEGTSRKKKRNELRRRQIKNALLMVFLSQGTPCIQAGDECKNSQNGNNNAWCLDSPVSWVNYNGGKTGAELYAFTRKLIAFRKKHPVFHQKTELLGTDYHSLGYPDISYHGENAWYPQMEGPSRQLGILYSGAYAEDTSFFVAYNMHDKEKSFALPRLPRGQNWYRRIDTSAAEQDCFFEDEEVTALPDQKCIMVPGRTIVVLGGE
ncbi:MAG: alpha-amylase family glycosyl hydrolase [Oscillospiraceae bacterium]|nr:alpha-amylase family glycosyl hydrolase [Oscillospiraceae bacterium]